MNINDYTAKKLRELRLKNKLTQDEVSKALKYKSRSSYKSIELDQNTISVEKVYLACRLYNISLMDFFDDFYK